MHLMYIILAIHAQALHTFDSVVFQPAVHTTRPITLRNTGVTKGGVKQDTASQLQTPGDGHMCLLVVIDVAILCYLRSPTDLESW